MEENKEMNLDQTPAGSAPAENEPEGGISFGGGAQNAYITAFASKPQYERTLEEIELDEKKGNSTVDQDRRARMRAEAKRHQEEFAAQQIAILSGTKPIERDDDIPSPHKYADTRTDKTAVLPDMRSVPQNNGRISLIDPLEDDVPYDADPDAVNADGEYADDEASEEAQAPRSAFRRIFSDSKGFSVFTLIAGILSIVCDIMYISGAITRNVMMADMERTLLLQGQTSYTLIFESPMLGLLKFFMILLVILTLVWLILFKKTDNKGIYYNRKIAIAFICLIAFTMLLLVIDLTSLHLLP